MDMRQALAVLEALPDEEVRRLEQQAELVLGGDPIWIPNDGPQRMAMESEADEIFYGGSAGGGKTDLIIGLSLTQHQRSLVLRRLNVEASKLFDRYREILGHDKGWNGQRQVWRFEDGRTIDIGGCQLEDDKQKYKGTPHDLIGFDEVSDFTETQYKFITIWNRSANPEQRCRVLAAGNPPTRPEGLWVIQYWAPWLDPTHPVPAAPGELRWFLGGKEVDGPGPHLVDGKPVLARSRTFIPAKLSDNVALARTNYDSVLADLPEELRRAYRDGIFDTVLEDDAYQVIPTAWVKAAQERWKPTPPEGIPMCTIGVDVAQGGADNTILAPRYDGWYAPLVRVPGSETPDGSSVAALVVKARRNEALPIIDMGGGYGGSALERLQENGIECLGFKGAESSSKRTKDQMLKFSNKRTEAYWRLREALDPGQDGGSPIALPPDPRIVADLTAPKFEVRSSGLSITPKEKLVKELGRSPDDGDAIAMAWYAGPKAITHAMEWRQDQMDTPAMRHLRGPQVITRRVGGSGPRVNYGPRRGH